MLYLHCLPVPSSLTCLFSWFSRVHHSLTPWLLLPRLLWSSQNPLQSAHALLPVMCSCPSSPPWTLRSLRILLHVTHHLRVLAAPIVSPSWCQGFKTTFPVYTSSQSLGLHISVCQADVLPGCPTDISSSVPPSHNPSLPLKCPHPLVIPGSVNPLPAVLCFMKTWAYVYQGLTECRLHAKWFHGSPWSFINRERLPLFYRHPHFTGEDVVIGVSGAK